MHHIAIIFAFDIIFEFQSNHTHYNLLFIAVTYFTPSLTGAAEVGFSVSKEGMAWGPIRRAERLQVNERAFAKYSFVHTSHPN